MVFISEKLEKEETARVRENAHPQRDEVNVDMAEKRLRHRAGFILPPDDLKIIEKDQKGFVVWFSIQLGYGFVSRVGDERDYFLHRVNIAKPNLKHLVASVAPDEEILFDIAEGRKGFEAINVRSREDGTVKGFRYTPRVTTRVPPLWTLLVLPAEKQPNRHYGQKVTAKFTKKDGVRRLEIVKEDRWTSDSLIEQGLMGSVKFFDCRHGWGFITRDDTDETVYVHRTSILKPNPQALISSLADGEQVRFDLYYYMCMDEVRTEAINVTARDGGAVCGKAFVPRIGATHLMVWELRVLCGGWIPSRMAHGLNVDLNDDRAFIDTTIRKSRAVVRKKGAYTKDRKAAKGNAVAAKGENTRVVHILMARRERLKRARKLKRDMELDEKKRKHMERLKSVKESDDQGSETSDKDESNEAGFEKHTDRLLSMSELEKDSRWKPWNSILNDECDGVRMQKSTDVNERGERDVEGGECIVKDIREAPCVESKDEERVEENSTNKASDAKGSADDTSNAKKNTASSEGKSLEGLVDHVIKSIKKLGIK